MKKNYTSIIVLLMVLLFGVLSAQETQKNFINYQGVARNAENELMVGETMVIGIALKVGRRTAAPDYEENHTVNTDANGVFSLKIGNGDTTSGNYSDVLWGSGAIFVTVSVNGIEVGTTEMMAVPYALSSGDGAQDADEVPYDNTESGLTAINAQQAIDELVGSGAVDADADPTNEIQDISLSGTDLSISEGSTIDLSAIVPPGGTDDQNANEVPFDNTASGLVATDAQAAIDELATSGLVDTDDQDLSLSGTTLQITDGTGVDLSPIIPPGGTDDQNAAEVPFDNTVSGLVATDAQAAIDELATSGLVDTDDQDLSLSGTTLQITDGTGVDLSPIIPPGGTDDQNAAEVPFDNTVSGLVATDAQTAIDELATSGLVDTDDQDLSLSGTTLQITDGTGVDLSPIIPPGGTDDQNLTFDDLTNLLEIEDGNVVDLSSLASGGGSSLWEENADGVYRNTGTVGIGTTPSTQTTLLINTTDPAVRDGIYSRIAHAGYKVAISGRAESNDAANTFGSRSDVRGESTGTAWAYRGDIGGTGTGTKYGLDLIFYGGTAGTKYGVYSDGEDMNYFSGDMGIGTTTPTAELDVAGSIRSRDLSGAGERNVVADTDGNLIISAGGGGSSLWSENGSDIFYNSGAVGIGTSNPEDGNVLQVGGDMLVQTNLGELKLGFPENGNQWQLSTTGLGSRLQFASKPDGSGSFTNQFRMFQDGEFNLGNLPTSTDAWMHMLRNSTLSKPHLILEEDGNDFARLAFKNTTSEYQWHVAGFPSATSSQARLNFFFGTSSGGNNRMSITGDGNVGVNTTNPSARLTINQASQNVGTGLSFRDNTSNDDWHITHGYALRFHYGGALRGFISATTGAYTQSSDAKLKASVKALPNVMDKVTMLRPTTYHYKADKSQTKIMGFVAQEVQQLFPELVSRSEGDDILGINYSGFGVVAIRAIQEQQATIKLQNDKIADLEERLQRLEARLGN